MTDAELKGLLKAMKEHMDWETDPNRKEHKRKKAME